MDVLKILFAMIVISLIIVLLKNYRGELSAVMELSAVIAAGFVIVSGANVLTDSLNELTSLSSATVVFLKVLLKALIISVMTDIASSFCVDCSNNTLAKCVDLIGKTAILSLSFPLLKEFTESIIMFLK